MTINNIFKLFKNYFDKEVGKDINKKIGDELIVVEAANIISRFITSFHFFYGANSVDTLKFLIVV